MLFSDAFNAFIQDQKVVGWGFQQPTQVMLPNGYAAFPCGYYTLYENNYRLMVNGASLGATAIQEALILDPEGVPVARDTEDIR